MQFDHLRVVKPGAGGGDGIADSAGEFVEVAGHGCVPVGGIRFEGSGAVAGDVMVGGASEGEDNGEGHWPLPGPAVWDGADCGAGDVRAPAGEALVGFDHDAAADVTLGALGCGLTERGEGEVHQAAAMPRDCVGPCWLL